MRNVIFGVSELIQLRQFFPTYDVSQRDVIRKPESVAGLNKASIPAITIKSFMHDTRWPGKQNWTHSKLFVPCHLNRRTEFSLFVSCIFTLFCSCLWIESNKEDQQKRIIISAKYPEKLLMICLHIHSYKIKLLFKLDLTKAFNANSSKKRGFDRKQ